MRRFRPVQKWARWWTLLPLRPSGQTPHRGLQVSGRALVQISGIRLPEDTDASETSPFLQLPVPAPNGRLGPGQEEGVHLHRRINCQPTIRYSLEY